MKLSVKVDQTSTASELIILGALFESLALAREGHVVSVPAEECNGDDPTPAETVVVQVPPAAGEEPPKRKRRTRAEIEAENAARSQVSVNEPPAEPVGAEPGTVPEPEPEGKLYYWSHPESGSFGIDNTQADFLKTLASDPCVEAIDREQYEKLVAEKAAVGNVETPAPTPDATVTDTAPAQAPAEPEPASASPSEGDKTYTHAEVQALAVDTARRYGPEKVKALIATYPNATKIAELDEGDLAGFVAKLQAITA